MIPALLRATLALLAFLLANTALAGDVAVSAAISLSNAFKEIAQEYAKTHPDTKVRFNFGASDALLRQIAHGAPVDLIATADQESMDVAQRQGLILPEERRNFARNALVLVAPTDSQLTIGELGDLRGAGVKRIAAGNPASVPAGRYAKRAIEAAGLGDALNAKLVLAQSARQVLDYVVRGEVDAGFVYATDAAVAHSRLRVLRAIPLDVPLRYPMAPVAKSAHSAEAREFMAYILSPRGQAILARYGYNEP